MSKIPLPTVLRFTVIIVWMILFGALLQRDYFVKSLDIKETDIIERARQESFMGIYFQDERIGYVKNRLTENKDADGLTLHQEAFMRLNILDQNHPVKMKVTAELSRGQVLRNFIFTLSSPFYEMEARGRVEGNSVQFTLSTGKEKITDRIRLSQAPFLSTNHRSYLLKQDLKAGDKVKIPYFDPISLSGKDTIIEYSGKEKILINGRIYILHHFVENFSGMKISSWLDDEGKVIKEKSPAGFVFVSEPEFKATDIVVKGKEVLSSVSVPLSGTLPDLTNHRQISYRLTLPTETDFDLNSGRQEFSQNILTVSLENLPQTSSTACPGPAKELAATPYIQSGNNYIAETAEEIISNIDDDFAKIKKISTWVYENLEKRPVLGIPDALTTLHSRRGDCNEHAALFAALARNVKIPTRIVAGVTFHNQAFYYHAWNEVCIDGSWLSLDTTKNQIPADITHIKFIQGETAEMVKIGALLGKLKIEVIDNQ